MLSKENEQFDEDLARMRKALEEESKNKRKLEQVLRDAARAMKQALTVSRLLAEPLSASVPYEYFFDCAHERGSIMLFADEQC